MKTYDQSDQEAKVRKTIDLVFSITLAIITQLFMSWKLLLIFAGIYAFLKANLLYSYLKRNPIEFFLKPEDLDIAYEIDDPLKRINYIKGLKDGYLTSQWILQLLLTFILVTGISSITKLLFGFALTSTVWAIIFILSVLLITVLTIKKIWN